MTHRHWMGVAAKASYPQEGRCLLCSTEIDRLKRRLSLHEQVVKVSRQSPAQLLAVERASASIQGSAARLSSSSLSSSGSSLHRDPSRPFLQSNNSSNKINSNINYNHHQRTSPSWRQQYSVADESYIDYQTSLFSRPLRRLTWKETGHLLAINTAMFWPNYLYPPKDRRRVTPERRRRLLFSYAPDWIITVGLWIGVYFIDRVSGFRREFSLTDTSLQHTYTVHERVPVYALGLICLAPLIFYLFIGLYIMRSVWDLHAAVLGEVLSLALTISITTIIKVLVGRPRPDVIARCRPEDGAENGIPYGLVTSAICTTQNLGRLQEGFRSFPSGHASTAFAGLGFFGFYIAGKMHLFDQRGHTIKAWITLIPFTGAALIALTRVTDYRHHATDIIAGSLLGLGLAYFSYRLYYPPLHHPMAHKAYSPRIPPDEESKDGPEQVYGDEEEIVGYNGEDCEEGPEGTLRRPANGRGQGPAIPLRTSPSLNRGRDRYEQNERVV